MPINMCKCVQSPRKYEEDRESKEVLGCVSKGYVWHENRKETGRVEDTREGNRGVSAKSTLEMS